MGRNTCHNVHVTVRDNLKKFVLLPQLWVPGIELGSPGLVASTLPTEPPP